MMGRHHTKGAPNSADLLVCFPSRSHLTLMPKPICSPARPNEPNKRHHNHNHNHNHHRLKKCSTRGRGGQASPILWAKNKSMVSDNSEPTSPKVTCAGQIKVRHKSGSCKSWQSVMEEIERIHKRKNKKKPSWAESLGFKKEILQFLTCLRSIKFDFRCFGSFPESDSTTDDEEEDEEDIEPCHENHVGHVETNDETETSRAVFSKWYMVLQENQNHGFHDINGDALDQSAEAPTIPPPNALLLMRCRSAPAKSWLEEQEEHGEEDEKEEIPKELEKRRNKSLRCLMEEDKIKTKENLVVMRYEPDLYKISTEIAKETWVVGGMRDLLSRSRSWKI